MPLISPNRSFACLLPSSLFGERNKALPLSPGIANLAEDLGQNRREERGIYEDQGRA